MQSVLKLFCLTLFLACPPLMAFTQNLNIEHPVRFLALGDSYTIGQSVATNQRWPNQLSDSLAQRGITTDTLTIIATTGWRTDNLINAIKNKNLENKNYNLVSLLIGVNNQYQGRPFSQYVSEFPALLDSAIRYAGGIKSHVFVVSIPDYAYTPFGQQGSNPAYISQQIDQYNAYAHHIADSVGVTFFDITPISRLGLQFPGYVANDGLHPSGTQYTEWVKLMLETIDNELSTTPEVRNTPLTFSISPNPVTDLLSIELIATNENECIVQVYSMNGRIMSQQRFTGKYGSVLMANYPDGLYLLRIVSGGLQSVSKVLKQNG